MLPHFNSGPGPILLRRTRAICPPHSLYPGFHRTPDCQCSLNSELYPEVGSIEPSSWRVAPIPVTVPNHAEGAPGPSLLGTGD
jgi:hypothetical protein